MKYLVTNNSSDYELLDDETEIFLPKESRVLDKIINLSTLPSVFTVKPIRSTAPDSLGNNTSNEDTPEVEVTVDEVKNTSDEVEPEVTEVHEEEESKEGEDEMLMYLSTLGKDNLKKILTAKGDSNCTARSEWKIAQYIKDTYPDITDEEIKSILGE